MLYRRVQMSIHYTVYLTTQRKYFKTHKCKHTQVYDRYYMRLTRSGFTCTAPANNTPIPHYYNLRAIYTLHPCLATKAAAEGRQYIIANRNSPSDHSRSIPPSASVSRLIFLLAFCRVKMIICMYYHDGNSGRRKKRGRGR